MKHRHLLALVTVATLVAGCTPAPTAAPTSGVPSAGPTPVGTTADAGTDAFRIVAVGDTGMDDAAKTVFTGMGNANPAVGLLLGDLSSVKHESDYCALVNSLVKAPVEIIPGNHESLSANDGDIATYAGCLPDQMESSGAYPVQYYFDAGYVRVIMISPQITLPDGTRTYDNGTPEQAWLTKAINGAKEAGQWVVVGMHEPCFTVGTHGCATVADLTDLLIAEHVDLVLAAHDHNYARTQQLSGSSEKPVIADSDGTFAKGAGTVFVTIGNGGNTPGAIKPLDDIWATASGTSSPGGIDLGFGQLDVTQDRIAFTALSTSGPHAGSSIDGFTLTA